VDVTTWSNDSDRGLFYLFQIEGVVPSIGFHGELLIWIPDPIGVGLSHLDLFNSCPVPAALVTIRGLPGSRDDAIVSGDGFCEKLVPEVPAEGQIQESSGGCQPWKGSRKAPDR